jgi:type I site-specific restriction endonuclease
MVSKLIDQMTQKEEDDLTKAFKFKMMMDMMEGGKKESTIDDYIKLLQILNPSRASEIEKLREEFTKINEASQKSMEEMKKTSETNLSQLRSEIITLYKDLISSQQSSSFEEIMKKQLEFQRRVREYAEAMGWIKEMKLPSNKEEWKPEDYINVINKIAEMVKDVMGAMKGIRSSGNPEKAPAVEKMPESITQQVQEQPVPQP